MGDLLVELPIVTPAKPKPEGGVTCSDAESSICAACVIGYRGDGRSKCSEIENCKYPRGHKRGPSCDYEMDDDGIPYETDLTCGQCKDGYYNGEEPCMQCAAIENCADGGVVCSSKDDAVCVECKPGYFLTEDYTCDQCGEIPHCIKTVCDSPDKSHCEQCAAGWFAAGEECAKLEFDNSLGVWVAMRSPGNLAF